jgi:hypothetical protein
MQLLRTADSSTSHARGCQPRISQSICAFKQASKETKQKKAEFGVFLFWKVKERQKSKDIFSGFWRISGKSQFR